jgi:hypothetical protein
MKLCANNLEKSEIHEKIQPNYIIQNGLIWELKKSSTTND